MSEGHPPEHAGPSAGESRPASTGPSVPASTAPPPLCPPKDPPSALPPPPSPGGDRPSSDILHAKKRKRTLSDKLATHLIRLSFAECIVPRPGPARRLGAQPAQPASRRRLGPHAEPHAGPFSTRTTEGANPSAGRSGRDAGSAPARSAAAGHPGASNDRHHGPKLSTQVRFPSAWSAMPMPSLLILGFAPPGSK